ncbi:MAG: hypothetical protein N2053_03995, partial [Chitinispirillaceae bacterium]|nr:hypothetical protein [Chitinispirillaceae bacterium]
MEDKREKDRIKKENNSPEKKGPSKEPLKAILIWIAIGVAVIFSLRTLENSGSPKAVSYTHL